MLFIGSTKTIMIGKYPFLRSGEWGKEDLYRVSVKIIEDLRSEE